MRFTYSLPAEPVIDIDSLPAKSVKDINDLPIELVIMVCKQVFNLCRIEKSQHPGLRHKTRATIFPLSAISVLSKMWQGCMEELLYQVLYISDYDIPEFASTVYEPDGGSRLKYVRHLRLNVVLNPYDCSKCYQFESATEISKNNAAFKRSLSKLIGVLASAVDREKGRGLTLELSAASPSDNQHDFTLYRCDPKYPFRTKEDLVDDYHAHECHARGRIHVVKQHDDSRVTFKAQQHRILGTELLRYYHGNYSKGPPELKVPIIRSLIKRLQPLRQINPACLGSLLDLQLDNVNCIRLEQHFSKQHNFDRVGPANMLILLQEFMIQICKGPWKENSPYQYQIREPRILSLFLSFVPSVIKSPLIPISSSGNVDPKHTSIQNMSRLLSTVSPKLDKVSAAFAADAVWFFNSGTGLDDPLSDASDSSRDSTESRWPKLKKLALTTFLLRPQNTRIWGPRPGHPRCGRLSSPASSTSSNSSVGTVAPWAQSSQPMPNMIVHSYINMSTAPPSAEPDNEDAASLRASQRLLEYAGRAALQMPELEVLEIWQTYTHEESIFRYDALAEPGPTVTFLSRFDMEPMWTKEAQTAWEAAAQKHTDNQKSLVVKYDTLDPHPDHFHGTFYIYGTINKLKLRDLVIDPVSLYAATWEECSATYITP